MQELNSLEVALTDVELRVAQAMKSTKRLASALGAASKSSVHGDLAALRRSLKDASDALRVVQVDVGSAVSSWSFTEEDECR